MKKAVGMIKGKLYGIGAGPGDPELLTIKAVKAIQKCNVIAVPKTGDSEGIAFSIIEKYLDKKELLECRFAMDKEIDKRKESRLIVANHIIQFLDDGKDVGFVTLGDPTTYSTYMYIHELIVSHGFGTEIIPGITSYTAAAAALGIALCESEEALMLIPGGHSENIDDLLRCRGNKVIMKSGESLVCILEKLKELGYSDKTKLAHRVTMNGQRLYASIEEYEKSPEAGYFTLALVKEKR